MAFSESNCSTAAQLPRMAGLVGIVTGAGTPHGIGRELVKKLAEAGVSAVYACDLNLSAIPSLQQEIKDAGHSTIVEGRVLDVSDEVQTVSIVREVTKQHGRFDFYFANAGFAHYREVRLHKLGQPMLTISGI